VSKDISCILAGWDFDPDEPQVRIVPGDDGREKLQMRVDLGLLQMELSGRPDGEHPFDLESLLDYYEGCARDSERAHQPFSLDTHACAALFREGLQYYHRYLALFHLQRYDLVARDTERNLRLFAFVVRHAPRMQDRVQFDRYRPYVTMMHSRALALRALQQNDYIAALDRIDAGIAGIRVFLREYDQEDREAECPELDFLLKWRNEVDRQRPMGPVERLEQQLSLAVAKEQFEEAARLRDQIRRLRGVSPTDETHEGTQPTLPA
jgi:UvrB/UvrC motif-containing protein